MLLHRGKYTVGSFTTLVHPLRCNVHAVGSVCLVANIELSSRNQCLGIRSLDRAG